MAKKKNSEKEERDPLSLFMKKSNSLVHQYFWPILTVLITSVLIFGLSIFYSYLEKQGNKKAEEQLYQVRKELVLAEEKAGGDILGFNSSQNFFGQTKKAKYNSEMDRLVNRYISLIKEWISKPVGLVAVAEMIHFLNQYEKQEQAMDLLKIATLHKKKNLVGFLIAFQSGTYLMKFGQYEAAVQDFQFITTNKNAEWLWPETLIKTALCYEKQSQVDQARMIYKRIKNDFSDSPSAEKAEQYLNLLQIRDKMSTQTGSQKADKKSGE